MDSSQFEPVYRGCLESIIEAGRVPVEARYVLKVARSSISDSEPIGGRPEQIQALAELSGADALINGTITILPRSLRVGKFVIGFWSARTGKSFAKATLESDDGIDPYDAGRLACRALVREHDE